MSKKCGGLLGCSDVTKDTLSFDGLKKSPFNLWDACGAPFAVALYRATPMDDAWMTNYVQEQIRKHISDFTEQMSGVAIADVPSSGDQAIAKIDLPDEVLVKLQVAFRRRDKQMVVQAIEKFTNTQLQSEELNAKLAVLKTVLQSQIQSADDIIFLLEAIQPILPQGLKEIGKETVAKSKAAKAGKKPTTEDAVKRIYPQSLDDLDKEYMEDAACTIAQARPTDAEWIKGGGVFGSHPGVYFGCHCSATWEFGGPTFCAGDVFNEYKEIVAKDLVDFEARYPRKPYNWYPGLLEMSGAA